MWSICNQCIVWDDGGYSDNTKYVSTNYYNLIKRVVELSEIQSPKWTNWQEMWKDITETFNYSYSFLPLTHTYAENSIRKLILEYFPRNSFQAPNALFLGSKLKSRNPVRHCNRTLIIIVMGGIIVSIYANEESLTVLFNSLQALQNT